MYVKDKDLKDRGGKTEKLPPIFKEYREFNNPKK